MYKLTLKDKEYNRLTFIFKDYRTMANFLQDALEANSGIEITITKLPDGEEGEE